MKRFIFPLAWALSALFLCGEPLALAYEGARDSRADDFSSPKLFRFAIVAGGNFSEVPSLTTTVAINSQNYISASAITTSGFGLNAAAILSFNQDGLLGIQLGEEWVNMKTSDSTGYYTYAANFLYTSVIPCINWGSRIRHSLGVGYAFGIPSNNVSSVSGTSLPGSISALVVGGKDSFPIGGTTNFVLASRVYVPLYQNSTTGQSAPSYLSLDFMIGVEF